MSSFSVGMSGHVVATKRDTDGNITQRLAFCNDVLDVGIQHLIRYACRDQLPITGYEGQIINQMCHLHLGTGTTEPTPSDSGLESRSGTLPAKPADKYGERANYFARDFFQDIDNGLYWTSATFTFKYGEGEAEGVWTELGLADDAAYTHPITRALFRDDNGDPISLTVLSDEFLEVTYTVRFYDGVGNGVAGSVSVGGTSYGYTIYPVKGNYQNDNGWRAIDDETAASVAYTTSGIWSIFWPFCNVLAYTSSLDDTEVTAFTGGKYVADSHTITYDDPTDTVTHSLVYDPTSSDVSLQGFLSCAHSPWSYDYGFEKGLYVILFDTPLVKKADYRLTLEISVSFNILLPPVTGIALDATTGTTLDFSWDAYPDAAQYNVVLRQAGTVIDTQTVTAPTTTASFTGLAAGTEYHLDIEAETASRTSAREILAGSTTA